MFTEQDIDHPTDLHLAREIYDRLAEQAITVMEQMAAARTAVIHLRSNFQNNLMPLAQAYGLIRRPVPETINVISLPVHSIEQPLTDIAHNPDQVPVPVDRELADLTVALERDAQLAQKILSMKTWLAEINGEIEKITTMQEEFRIFIQSHHGFRQKQD